MKAKLILPVCVALALSACSSQRNVAEGNFDYLDIKPVKNLEGTDQLKLQNPTNKYQVPVIAPATQPALGAEVGIRPPMQVIAAAPGSRIEEGLRESRIYFDAIDGVANLKDSIWGHLIQVVEAFDTPYIADEEQGLIRLERFHHVVSSSRKSGFFNLLSNNRLEQASEQAIELRLTMASHGRSGELEAKLIDPAFFVDNQPQKLPMNFIRSFEADVLNDVSIAMERTYRSDRAAFTQKVVAVSLGTTGTGNAAFTLSTDFNSVWVLLPEVFQKLNFVVDDLNQSEGMYYVSYEPFGKRRWYHALAFWKKSQTGDLNLKNGTEVTFGVDEVSGTVYLTPQIDGVPLTAEVLAQWLPMVADAFGGQQ
ncbi:outer membrane protein assembly factor BamC [Aliidiomarina quisquiliarum]|uniref:outer membrane protein assembly factor BamC n=1 Tax=Aliidiomarina quisquiliarum TaxID=2938947 RepID=UPI00208DF7C7|nr:outer membrane protein assembly factor BamC [Aliidiomarina quisquiliarum]MCO4320486.1 outer membrane protein assembly factor BamC [Aliidiomarina quisquiliarum]